MESSRSSPAQPDAVVSVAALKHQHQQPQGNGGGGAIAGVRATRLQVWFIRVCTSILVWTCLVQFVAVGHPGLFSDLSVKISRLVVPRPLPDNQTTTTTTASLPPPSSPPPPPVVYPSPRKYRSNGFLVVSCNGGLNQMRAAIGDMVVASRILNLTLVVPELDKTSFWRDPSNFDDIFDVNHFINSLRDEIRIVRRVPKKFTQKHGYKLLEMAPVSWSNDAYYLQQILPLFNKTKVLHFNKTDARLANNGIPLELQKLRCRVNFHALKFSPVIERLGYKLVQMLQERGPFMALHLRYEMDMLAFSGCTRGCTDEESEKLKNLRYAYPWWREKEIVSEDRRSQGLCPLTPEETALILQALGFDNGTQIYIAAGEIYGSERRMAALKAAFPWIVRKEKLLSPADLQHFHNHSSQMAALDFMVSVASDTFVPTYDGNMAKVVEGHRRYLGFKKTILLDRKRLVQLLDMHQNGTLSWNEFAGAVRLAHEKRMGQPVPRVVIPDKPKEEDYFYANPQECLCEGASCIDQLGPANSGTIR